MVNTTIELAPHDKEIAIIVNQNIKEIEDAICKALEKGQMQGFISKKHSAESLAHYLFNCMSGIRVASRSVPNKEVLDDIVTITLSVLKD